LVPYELEQTEETMKT